MSKPYYPLYIGDFFKETSPLDAESIGFYMLIKANAWCNNEQGFIEGSWTDIMYQIKAKSQQHAKQIVSKLEAKKIFQVEIISANNNLDLETVKI